MTKQLDSGHIDNQKIMDEHKEEISLKTTKNNWRRMKVTVIRSKRLSWLIRKRIVVSMRSNSKSWLELSFNSLTNKMYWRLPRSQEWKGGCLKKWIRSLQSFKNRLKSSKCNQNRIQTVVHTTASKQVMKKVQTLSTTQPN